MKRVLKILSPILTVLLIVMVLFAAFLGFSARNSPDGISTVAGHKLLNVLSGSMEPAIMTGDVIIIEELAPDYVIREGDVITYRAADSPDMLITHRVMGAILIDDEVAAYVTKGDNNDSEDLGTVTRDRIIGVYKWRLPLLGYFASFVRQPLGTVLLVIIPGLMIIGSEFVKIWRLLGEMEAKRTKAAVFGGPDEPPAS